MSWITMRADYNVVEITVSLALSICMSTLCTHIICHGNTQPRNKLLLLLLDGFRYDYITSLHTPNLCKLMTEGSSAPYINPVYPTMTAPAMNSIITGLYPESHGIVGNIFYDPDFDEVITIPYDETPLNPIIYNETEPIWITAAKSGYTTGVYNWPGSMFTTQGHLPDYFMYYNATLNFTQQTSQLMDWLDDKSLDFVAWHVDEPDVIQHNTGLTSQSDETMTMLRGIDNMIGDIMDLLDQRHMMDDINILVTADHGMIDCDVETKGVSLFDYIKPQDVKIIEDAGIVLNIIPNDGVKVEEVYSTLKGTHPKISVYLKEEIPERLHYKMNHRVQPIVAMPDEGWLIFGNASAHIPFLKTMHGYDNEFMSMKPVFLATGPDIKTKFKVEPFSHVDLYPLMCALLGITHDHPVNGTLDIAGQILKQDQLLRLGTQYALTIFNSAAVLWIFACVLVLYVSMQTYFSYSSLQYRTHFKTHEVFQNV